MKVYTKKGDDGTTTLKGGGRIPKDDVRIEANGQLDELNAVLGMVRASMTGREDKQHIELLQNVVMRIMGVIAGGEMDAKFDIAGITADMEKFIDRHQPEGKFCFVVPGESMLNAYLHYARTKARTAERRLWTMSRDYPLPGDFMKFMNRLSDYLFVLAVSK